MPTKNPKYQPIKDEKPKQKITWTQIAFIIFAVMLIVSMLLSAVTTNS